MELGGTLSWFRFWMNMPLWGRLPWIRLGWVKLLAYPFRGSILFWMTVAGENVV